MPNRLFPLLFASMCLFMGTVNAELQPDFAMDTDPDCRPQPPAGIQPIPEHRRLWIEALGRPETDYQRMAAESIALAHLKGISDMVEAIPALETVLSEKSSHPAARYAAARALIVLQSQSSAPKLFDASQKWGSDLKQLVEPTLAEWDYVPARTVWIERLKTVNARPQESILAMRGLEQVRDAAALSTLREIVLNLVQAPHLRIAAARAAGSIAESGLESEARQLIDERRTSPVVNRFCAIHLLKRHDSDAARQSLLELADDAEPSIAAAALERLNEIDSHLVLPIAERVMKNNDANVRLQGAIAYLKLPAPERIRPLAELLGDRHPGVRRHVCDGLFQLAVQPELEEVIRSEGMRSLQQEDWQSQAESALLLGGLEHQPAAGRMVELLESPREDVMINTAWGLRKIADRATIPAIIDKIRRQTVIRKGGSTLGIDQQVAHLFEACGKMKAKEAEPEMVLYVPKLLMMGERSRGAAIWSLGLLHEGEPDKKIATILVERVNDAGTMPPEFLLVKQMSVISLGRMKITEIAAEFRSALEESNSNDALSLSKRWAVKALTGEEFPRPEPEFAGPGTWFLTPIVRTKADAP